MRSVKHKISTDVALRDIVNKVLRLVSDLCKKAFALTVAGAVLALRPYGDAPTSHLI